MRRVGTQSKPHTYRRAELIEGRFHERHVLRQHLIQVATALLDVARHTARQSRVRVGVHEQFHVEQVTDRLEVEHQNALEQDHVGRVNGDNVLRAPARKHAFGLSMCPVEMEPPTHLQRIRLVVVRLDGDFLAVQDLLQHGQHLRFVERIRMVEIEQAFVGLRLLGGRQLPVEAVLANAYDLRTTHTPTNVRLTSNLARVQVQRNR